MPVTGLKQTILEKISAAAQKAFLVIAAAVAVQHPTVTGRVGMAH